MRSVSRKKYSFLSFEMKCNQKSPDKLLFNSVVLLLSLFLFSCNQNSKTPPAVKNSNVDSKAFEMLIDTNNSELTISHIKNLKPEGLADSLYRNFIVGLIKNNNFNDALTHLEAYKSYFNKTPQQQTFSNLKSGEVFNALAKYDSSIYYFTEALKINIEIQDSEIVAECEHNIGYNLQFIGDETKSLVHLYNALSYYEQKHDSENIFLSYYDIAEIYYRQKNFIKTLQYYEQCFDYYKNKRDTFQMAQLLTSLSDALSKLNKYDEAINNAVSAIALWTQIGDVEGKANCLNTLAGIYVTQKKWVEAIHYFTEAYDMVRETEFQRPVPVLLLNLGVCYTATGNFTQAEKYLLSSIEELSKIGLVNELQLVYKHTSELYKKKGKSDKALEYYERYDSIQDIASEKLSGKAIEELHLKYETAQKENKIMVLKNEISSREHASRLFDLFSIILILGLGLSMTLFIYHQKNRRIKLEKEKATKELELIKTRLKVEHDRKLMDGFAERILEKNKLISNLENKIKSIPGYNQSIEAARKSLEELSKLKILTAGDWDKFQMNYNKIFPGIIKEIAKNFETLTESELRMFLLIRLGVNTRQISSVLGISQDSVRKTRYRMRKKLNINEKEDLDEFVKKFSVQVS